MKVLPSRSTVRPGDYIRACFNARRSETRDLPPIVPARLSGPLRVSAVTWNAVRVGEQWIKRWVRCEKPRGGLVQCEVFDTPGRPRLWVLHAENVT